MYKQPMHLLCDIIDESFHITEIDIPGFNYEVHSKMGALILGQDYNDLSEDHLILSLTSDLMTKYFGPYEENPNQATFDVFFHNLHKLLKNPICLCEYDRDTYSTGDLAAFLNHDRFANCMFEEAKDDEQRSFITKGLNAMQLDDLNKAICDSLTNSVKTFLNACWMYSMASRQMSEEEVDNAKSAICLGLSCLSYVDFYFE